MNPVCRHTIGRFYSPKCHYFFVGTLIAHNTYTVYRKKDCSCLPNFVIQSVFFKSVNEYCINFLKDAYFLRCDISKDPDRKTRARERVAAKKLSVREAEKLVAKMSSSRQQSLIRVKADKPRDLLRIEQELSDALTAPVEIRVKKRTRRGEQGEVVIQFGSLDELNGLLDKLGLAKA